MRNLLLATAALLALAAPARADYILTYTQTADGVTASGLGSIDTAGLARIQTGSQQSAFTNGGWAAAGVGDGKAVDVLSVTIAGPSTFGSKGYTTATLSTGSFAAFSVNQKAIGVPTGYRSGAFMSGSSFYGGATLASMGLAAGDYTYRFGCDELFTVRVAAAPVPEPASVALLGAGLVAAGLVLRRRGI